MLMFENAVWTRSFYGVGRKRRTTVVGLATLTSALLLVGMLSNPAPAYAAVTSTVNLGAAASFSVLAGGAVTMGAGATVSANVGVSPGPAVTGPTDANVGGEVHRNDAEAIQAQSDLLVAYNDAAGRASTAVTADLGGQVLASGVYHSAAAFALTTMLTLDGRGNSDAVFIFQTDAALNTTASSRVILTGNAQASNVFWQVTAAATLGENSTFAGTILAKEAITTGAGTTVNGRALSYTAAAAVTLGAKSTFTGVRACEFLTRRYCDLWGLRV